MLANDAENYTYEHAAASGSGRGGGYHPPRYVRGPGRTYSAADTNVTHPPSNLDARFHFSGADVAGAPLTVTVQDAGAYSLLLTADEDPTHTPLALGAPLSGGLYTLEYQTTSLLGSQVTFTKATPSPILGDLNGDGAVNNLDIYPFSLALTDAASYAAAFPLVDAAGVGDIDMNGGFNNLDIAPLAALLTGGPASVPEPQAWALAMLGCLELMGARTYKKCRRARSQ